MVPGEARHFAAEQHVALELFAAEIQEAVGEPQILAHALILQGEGQGRGGIEDAEARQADLDITGGHVGVLAFAFGHHAFGSQHELAAHGLELGQQLGIGGLLVGHQLHQAPAVPEVQEDQGAEVAHPSAPAEQTHGLARVVEAQIAIAMGALEVVKPIEFHSLTGSHPGAPGSSRDREPRPARNRSHQRRARSMRR